ncbi:MAG TPA: hypothetical protein VGS96_18790 [Thermoanaerobaculia bacterium]|nr:hypothetical protein [Thermoanaerobaculia bacterium]
MRHLKTIAAFALAPLATPLAIAVAFLLADVLGIGWFAGKNLGLVLSNATLYAIWSLPLAYASAILLGVPAYVLARNRRWFSFSQFLTIGIAVAVIPLLVVFAVIIIRQAMTFRPAVVRLITSSVTDAASWLFLFSISGAASGALFWLIETSNTHDRHRIQRS